jgi:hypothetical protein
MRTFTNEELDAITVKPVLLSLALVMSVATALTMVANVDPELGESMAGMLAIVPKALHFFGIPYTGKFATGPLPAYVYFVNVALAIWWAIFSSIFYAAHFLIVNRPWSDPFALIRRIEKINKCDFHRPRIWAVQFGILVMWAFISLFFLNAVIGFFPFHLSDGLAELVFIFLVAVSGIPLLVTPLMQATCLAYDFAKLSKWIGLIAGAKVE